VIVARHPQDGKSIVGSLMEDGLHPNAQGYEAMLEECLWPALQTMGVTPHDNLPMPIAQWRRAVHDEGSKTPRYRDTVKLSADAVQEEKVVRANKRHDSLMRALGSAS
jgi:hypothetical protein